jgi:hypothetical protein
VRRAMFSEPLLAHPAEIGGVHATWHPHSGKDDDRDQHHGDADDEQHMVLAAVRFHRRITILTLGRVHCLCGCAQGVAHVNSEVICAIRLRRRAGVATDEDGELSVANAAATCAIWKEPAFGRRPRWEVALTVHGLRVHLRTARFNVAAYTCHMQLVSIKAIIAMLWVTVVFIVGIAWSLNSFSSWTILAGVAVVPPLVMMWRWNDSRQTMSETIQKALR